VLLRDRLDLAGKLLVGGRRAVEGHHRAGALVLDVGERVGERGVELRGRVGLDAAEELLDGGDAFFEGWGSEGMGLLSGLLAAAARQLPALLLLTSNLSQPLPPQPRSSMAAQTPRHPPAAASCSFAWSSAAGSPNPAWCDTSRSWAAYRFRAATPLPSFS
jgi:hypothetical protein